MSAVDPNSPPTLISPSGGTGPTPGNPVYPFNTGTWVSQSFAPGSSAIVGSGILSLNTGYAAYFGGAITDLTGWPTADEWRAAYRTVPVDPGPRVTTYSRFQWGATEIVIRYCSFDGNATLTLQYSTDFTPASPSAATWTTLAAGFPLDGSTWNRIEQQGQRLRIYTASSTSDTAPTSGWTLQYDADMPGLVGQGVPGLAFGICEDWSPGGSQWQIRGLVLSSLTP